jgi:RHS repeat-associated protein
MKNENLRKYGILIILSCLFRIGLIHGQTTTELSTNTNGNSVSTITFDTKGNVTGQAINYSDELGRLTQTLSRDITNNRVIVNQTLYDSYGRSTISTLPAPVLQSTMDYVPDFVTNPEGTAEYNYLNFEKTLPTTPDIINGQLANYYSNSNINEPYVPASNYPYTRLEYSKLNPGVVRKSALAGKDHCIGSGRESQSYTISSDISELNPFAEKFANIGNISLEIKGVTKTITIDADKNTVIVYKSANGKTISSCYVDSTATSIDVAATVTSGVNYVDIHVCKQQDDIVLHGDCSIYNLENDAYLGFLTEGTIHLSPGFYRLTNFKDPLTKEFIDNEFTINYKLHYIGHSFNLYDEAGRLKYSISPKGYSEWVNETAKSWETLKKYATYNEYNSLGWLLSAQSPDEGKSIFIYDTDGKILFSENEEQRNASTRRFSYTVYDVLGRAIESGEKIGSVGSPKSGTIIDASVFRTVYDEAFSSTEIGFTGKTQNYTLGKISKTWNQNCITYYSYTYDGKIEWVAQQYTNGPGTKTIEYKYNDDILGRLDSVIYQRRSSDQFTHRYVYDLDGRLTDVYTKAYGQTEEKLQAHYIYYAHGPLKRVEIAGNLQGIDYVYNINGWLKSINSPDLTASADPGGDGATGAHSGFGSDLFGMSLDYYSGDYERNGSNIISVPGTALYNGNISANRWKNKKFDQASANTNAYQYTYNNRGFLNQANFGTVSSGSFTNSGAYNETITDYDLNGNILGLTRYASYNNTSKRIDALTYNYYTTSNQLKSVNDAETQTAFTTDVKNQASNNYTYNKIGLVISNIGDNQFFTYDVYGHVTQITNSSGSILATYTYDDKGFRIKKEAGGTTTWYVRDLSGQIISTYLQNATTYTLNEVNLYGSSRIGQALANSSGSIEKYQYELTDHLGNVRVTFCANADGPKSSETLNSALIGDKLVTAFSSITLMPGFDTNGHCFVAVVDGSAVTDNITTLTAATDYYPFGMEMPGRKYQSSDSYKFGYQGQYAEKDAETGYNHFEARDYDSRLGRWLATDPAGQYWSPYLGMGNNPVSGIDPDGRETDTRIIFKDGSKVDINDGSNAVFYASGNTLTFLGYGYDGYTGNYGVKLPFGYNHGIDEINLNTLSNFAAFCGVLKYNLSINGNLFSRDITPKRLPASGLCTAVSPEFDIALLAFAPGMFAAKTGGVLADDVAATFSFGRYTEMTLDQPMVLSRYYDNVIAFAKGRFMTNSTSSFTFMDRIGMAIRPSWNGMTKVANWEIPAGSTIYKGRAAMQFPWLGGKTQYFVPEVGNLKRVIK